MQQREIGRTGIKVSALGFGTAPIGGQYHMLTEFEAGQTVLAALAAGIGLFDCSPLYGAGLAEHRLGAALREARVEAMVSCRVGALLHPLAPDLPHPQRGRDSLPFGAGPGLDGPAVLRGFEDCLQRLGRARIDILSLEDPPGGWDEAGPQGPDPLAATAFAHSGYAALVRLKEEGSVGAIGLAVADPDRAAQMVLDHAVDVVVTRHYTLLDQRALARLLPACQRRGVAVIAAAPFGAGILASRPRGLARPDGSGIPVELLGKARRIDAICREHDVPLPAAALQFALLHPSVVSVVAGMVAPEQAAQNAALMRHPVPSALWDQLREEGLIDPGCALSSDRAAKGQVPA